MKVLFLTPRVPHPPDDGGAIAMHQLITGLAERGHEVMLFALNTPKHHQPTGVFSGVREVFVDIDTTLSTTKALKNLLFGTLPYNLERFDQPAAHARLVELLKAESFDVIQFEGTFVAPYLKTVRQHTDAPCVLRAHNLEHQIWHRLAEGEASPVRRRYLNILARRMKKFEVEVLPHFDGIAAISPGDAAQLKDMGAQQVEWIPAAVKLPETPDSGPSVQGIAMLASMDWLPNVEAFEWCRSQIWPVLRKAEPTLRWQVAGKHMPEQMESEPERGIEIQGYVADAAAFIRVCPLVVVPLKSGGGMRVKIIEALALGRPVVSTSVGAEGIEASEAEGLFLADDPDAFVKQVLRILRQPTEWEARAKAAQTWVMAHFGSGEVLGRLERFHEQLVRAKGTLRS